jgi:type VI secretion system protein ImpL
MSKVSRFFKSRRTLVAIGCLFLVALVWLVLGWWLDMDALVCLIATCGVLVLFILYLVIEQAFEKKQSEKLEKSIWEQSEEQKMAVRPEKREEIENLRQELSASIQKLKKSKLGGGRRGTSALYALPWYMIIGPPAAGKTTAIRNSGLEFPFGTDREIQGVGGTRNCDWWFSNSAIILDTAGRYTTEDEDREEWTAFLDILKKNRKRQPINGVMVCISIADLMNARRDELEWHARTIRKRIDELLQQLGVRYPVYLIFTKCDLINGFVEFFEDFGLTQREQVWGCSLTAEQQADPKPRVVFEKEFETLHDAIVEMRLARLTPGIKRETRSRIFAFPMEFLSMKENLAYFVGNVFQPNPYQEAPLFRGFYFTSGTQEGVPIDKVVASIAQAFGLSPEMSEQFNPEIQTKSYFIENLFTDIIIPDDTLVRPTSKTGKTLRYFRVGLISLIVGGLLLFVLGVTQAYFSSKDLLATSSARVANAKTKLSSSAYGLDYFDNLDNVRQEILRLEEKSFFSFSFGMDRRNAMWAPTCNVYFTSLEPFLKERIYKALASRLSDASIDKGELYEFLKAYLLLGDKRDLVDDTQRAFLNGRLSILLAQSFPEASSNARLNALVKEQLQFFLQRLNNDDDDCRIPQMTSSPDLVQRARSAIKLDKSFLVYKGVIGSVGGEPIKISAAPFEGEYVIDPAFTKTGWEKVKELLGEGIEKTLQEQWVLARADAPEEAQEDVNVLRTEVLDLYFKDYEKEWLKPFRSVNLKPYSDLNNAKNTLKDLSDPGTSPIAVLLKKTAEETQLQEVTKSFFDRFAKYTPKLLKGMVNSDKPTTLTVDQQFAGLHALVNGSEGQELQGLLQKFSSLAEEFEQAQNDPTQIAAFAEKTFKGSGGISGLLIEVKTKLEKMKGDPILREGVAKMFTVPLIQTWDVFLKFAQDDLNDRWKTQVFDTYKDGIAKKFPFSSESASDATVQEIDEFFKQGVPAFAKENLKSFCDEKSLDPKLWQGQGIRISSDTRAALRNAKAIGDFFGGQKFSLKFISQNNPDVEKVCIAVGAPDNCFEYDADNYKPTVTQSMFQSGTSTVVIRLIRGTKNLLFFSGDDKVVAEKKEEGDWAWLKFHWSAQPLPGGQFQVVLKTVEGGSDVQVVYSLKPDDAKKFTKAAMSFSCPPQLN